MISALIVDDEKIIRVGLRKMLLDLCPEIDRILEAENGAEALEISRSNCPDIAIVDIRTPQMTGLEYAKAVQTLGLKTKVVVLSGYADFEYAREAISYGCCAYLLKPVKIQELETTMQKIIGEINFEREQKNINIEEREKEQALYQALTTGVIDNREFHNATRDRCFYSAVLYLTSESMMGKGLNYDDVYMALRAVFSANGWACIPSVAPEKRCVLALLFNQQDFVPENEPDPERMLETVQIRLAQDGIDCSIGLSGPWQGITKLKQSYKLSRAAAERSFYDGIGKVYIASEAISTSTPATYEAERLFISNMRSHKSEEARTALHNMFTTMQERRTSKTACITVLAHLYINLLELLHAQPGVNALTSKEFCQQLEDLDTFRDMCHYSEDCYMSLISIRNREHSGAHDIVVEAIAYINQNISKPISVNDVAAHLGLSASYLSTVFSRETGEKLISYIIMLKMEKACAMLEEGKDKIYEISSSLGYSDVKYFCKLFKKYIGCTPSEYRERP